MTGVFKKYFIPHHENGYRPHFFRLEAMAAVFLFVAAIFGLAFTQMFVLSRTHYLGAVLPGVLVDMANQDRGIYNLTPLVINKTLQEAAQEKANDMATRGYFAHVSPTGITPWYWFTKAGYRFIYAGENLAINFNDSSVVNQAWMNSPGHRANILNVNFTEVGIATAEGVYQGQPTIFVAQMFGRPAPIVVPTPSPTLTAVAHAQACTKPQPGEESVLPVVTSREFVAVRNVDVPEPVPAVSKSSSLQPPASSVESATQYATLPQKVLSSPKMLLDLAYLLVVALVLFAILLSLGIELKKHHAKHVFSGLLMLLVVIGLSYLYQQYAGTVVIL